MGRLITLLAILILSIPVVAQDEPQPTPIVVTFDDVNDVAQRLYCPVCENEPLHTCAAPACIEWREEIREQLAEGQTSDQIVDYFVTYYGDRVVGIPQDDGLRVLSVAAPVLVVILGLILGVVSVRRWNATQPEPQPVIKTGTSEDETYRSQLEEDLRL